MSLSIRISPQLALRQSLEINLGQVISIKPELKISLTLYKEREGICTKLYKDALKKGNVRQYEGHGMTFEFALVSIKDVPEFIYKQCGHAFSHCLMSGWDALLGGQRYARSRGSWLLFVIHDMYPEMPEKAIEYVAVHERGEMVTLGDHNLASKLEFAIAAKENKLRWYMNWIEVNCPASFADVFSYQVHLDLPDTEKMRDALEVFQSSEEAELVLNMIEEFEWPYSVLQRLSKYKKVSDEVAGIISRAISSAESYVSSSLRVVQITTSVDAMVKETLHEIVERGFKQYVSIARVGDLWRKQLISLDTKFAEVLTNKQQLLGLSVYIDELGEAGNPNSLGLPLDFAEMLALL